MANENFSPEGNLQAIRNQTAGLPSTAGPQTGAASMSVVPASDGFRTSGAGITASASFTPTAVAYGAGDVIDVSREFAFTYADGTAIPTGSLIRILTSIMKIDVAALQASEAAYTLHNYAITQPSAQADNDAWTLASADLTSYRGSISLGTPVDLGAALYVKTPLVDIDIKLTTSSVWGRLVTVAGFTPTAVARQVLLYGIVL